jgi:hypothetical protein
MPTFSKGNWSLEWEDIGEGLSGDYNPKDSADVSLLRANLSYKGFPTVDGSYCTSTPVGTSDEDLKKLSDELFDKLPSDLDPINCEGDIHTKDQEWHFPDRIMQEWTWLSYANKPANCDTGRITTQGEGHAPRTDEEH